jgi:hypothetical protein
LYTLSTHYYAFDRDVESTGSTPIFENVHIAAETLSP